MRGSKRHTKSLTQDLKASPGSLSSLVGTILALTTDDLRKASFPKVRRGKLDTVVLGEQIAARKAQILQKNGVAA